MFDYCRDAGTVGFFKNAFGDVFCAWHNNNGIQFSDCAKGLFLQALATCNLTQVTSDACVLPSDVVEQVCDDLTDSLSATLTLNQCGPWRVAGIADEAVQCIKNHIDCAGRFDTPLWLLLFTVFGLGVAITICCCVCRKINTIKFREEHAVLLESVGDVKGYGGMSMLKR